ncbi:hypothetical protein F511_03811 [Dorcoceras hygrometricum]|uniref:Uncharacterized protein n=1 Tax=Dorcoceras hygrometricum TaxID=472368 RepID=A0A2Z7BVY8_9LAMI|nr:hypothetical protein F511_03811 [Dorcoceras hygrometricum]
MAPNSRRILGPNNKELMAGMQSSSELCCMDESLKGTTTQEILGSVCSTPKGKRFKIPETLECPPAPKKRRLTSKTCSFKRRSYVKFFAPPEIEGFFSRAFQNNILT